MANKYTPEQKEFIKQNVKGRKAKDVAGMFNERFGTGLEAKHIASFKKNNKLRSGLDCTFRPGHTPANKGKKMVLPVGVATQFKPGSRPHNQVLIGIEVVRDDGYLWRKIGEPNKWKQVHRIMWEEANGKVPEGYRLLFTDGDRMNISLDNLILVSAAEVLVMNKKKLIKTDKELTRAGANVAKLIVKINQRKR